MPKQIKFSNQKRNKEINMKAKKDAPRIARGKKASSPKGFAQNIKREETYGAKPKKAVAIAYGEADYGKKVDRAKKVVDKFEDAKEKRKSSANMKRTVSSGLRRKAK